MTIGVDGGALSVDDPRLKAGVYTVAYNTLMQMKKYDYSNNYRIYMFKRGEESVQKLFGGLMTQQYYPLPKGFMSAYIPFEFSRHPVDVFLGLSQILPKTSYNISPFPQFDVIPYHRVCPFFIGFVYDLGFMHAPHWYPESSVRLKAQTQDLLTRADHIVTISEYSKRDIEKTFADIPHGPVTVAYPGISPIFSTFGPAYKSEIPYILAVGSLKPSKNIPSLIRAFSRFLKLVKIPYELILVGGDYWPDPAIATEISRLRLEKFVRRAGTISDDELVMYYRGARVFANTSLYEGFGLPVAQALATGTPVVVYKSGAVPEIIGNAGLMAESGDETGFAKALYIAATSRTYRDRIKVLGMKRAQSFQWETFGSNIRKLYPPRKAPQE